MAQGGRAGTGRRRHPRAAAIWAVAVVVLGVAGCSDPNPVPVPTKNATAINPDSMRGNASDKAKAIMARADNGETLTRFDLDEAAANAMDCLEAAGITPGLRPPADLASGYSISWSYDVGDGPDAAKADQLDAIGNNCVDTEYYPVEALYLSQPESMEAQDAKQEQWRVAAIACLATTTHAQDDHAPWQEVATALTEDFLERRSSSCYDTIGMAGDGH